MKLKIVYGLILASQWWNADFAVEIPKWKIVLHIQIFDLRMTSADLFLHSTRCPLTPMIPSTFFVIQITDGITGTYCGMAPRLDLKAKFSLSESVELAPEKVKNNDKCKIWVISITASKSKIFHFYIITYKVLCWNREWFRPFLLELFFRKTT